MMNIAYLQKVTLQDFPNTIACIVFLSGCSFRCGMCYNARILDTEYKEMEEKDFFDFLDKRKGKIEGVVVSGGEPLIHDEILVFLQKIRDRGMKIKIDTNGSFPERLKEVINAGLADYVAMDIKTSKEDYDKVAGVKVDLKKIEESMRILSESAIEHEFRTTLCPIVEEKGLKSEDFKQPGKYREMDEKDTSESEDSEGDQKHRYIEMSASDVERIAEWIASIDDEARYYLQPFFPEEGRLLNKELEKEKKTKFETLEKAKERAERFLKRVQIRG